MSVPISITGNILKRFVQSSTLLWLLDPVRGEATTHSLDRYPNDTPQDPSQRQCGKFLDSIALICATGKNGDTVSAATLEEGSPQGPIIRVARNAGFPDETLKQVEDIVTVLNRVADEGQGLPPDVETYILTLIVRLDMEKIKYYLEKMQKYSNEVEEFCNWIVWQPDYLDDTGTAQESRKFRYWVAKLPLLTQQPVTSLTNQLLDNIKWASDAKWVYGRFIEATFKAQGRAVAPWVVNVYKLGRYSVASKVLVKFAMENRDLFCPMRVVALDAAPKQRFEASMESHLSATLRRIMGQETAEISLRLARHWNTHNAERYFRSKLPHELAVHAEMQLLTFYEHNPEKMPRTRFIGVSKKSCFLCHKFLESHPLNFAVSGCHQKLYLSWCIAPCTDVKIYKKYKDRAKSLTLMMESAVKHEIDQRLGVGGRRPAPLDSTAGVSLSTNAVQQRLQTPDDGDGESRNGSIDYLSDDSLWQQDMTGADSGRPATDRSSTAEISTPSSSFDGGVALEEVSKAEPRIMTFNVKRADNSMRQDVVAMSDIMDAGSGKPSWDRLCAILATEERLGIGFDERNEFIMVNQKLPVGSARQFNACLEYLRNEESWNNEALVHKYKDVPSL